MTITRVNPSGWTDDLDPITAAQINAIDTNLTYPIDGRGGAYTPNKDIDITGPFGIELQGTLQMLLAARSITRHVAIAGETDTPANWTYGVTDFWTNAVASAGLVYVPLNMLPHGQSLSEVHIRVDPAVHGAGLDVTPPVFNVHEIDEDLGVITTLGPSTDSTGGVIANGYNNPHWFSLTAIGHTIDRSQYRYRLAFAGETGANWVAGAIYTCVTVVCSCTSYPEF